MTETPAPRKILVAVDPAQDELHALNRVIISTEMYKQQPGSPRPFLHVLLSVDVENTDTSVDNPNMYRDYKWFSETVMAPLEKSGLDYDVTMCWSTDWYGSLLKVAKERQVDLLVLPVTRKFSPRDRIFNESIWRLFRTAASPVLVVRPGAEPRRKTVLAAVNVQSHKAEYQRLNDLIIKRARWMAEGYGADLHLVNAYDDSLNYPDRGQLASLSGIDTSNIHVRQGDPDEVIAKVVKDIDADIVVLGTQSRYNRWRGNTSERIITRIDCDILAIN